MEFIHEFDFIHPNNAFYALILFSPLPSLTPSLCLTAIQTALLLLTLSACVHELTGCFLLFVFLKFKMDGQNVIMNIQWLKTILVLHPRRYHRIFLTCENPKTIKTPCKTSFPKFSSFCTYLSFPSIYFSSNGRPKHLHTEKHLPCNLNHYHLDHQLCWNSIC